MEIYDSSGLPIPMVPRLHQSNVYIKRKLRVWIAQKCTALVGAETVFTSAGLQTTPFYGWQHRDENGNMRNFGPANPHATAFTPSNGYIKTKLRVWRAQKCIALVRVETILTSAGSLTTPFYGWQYTAENGNMRKFVPTNSHGTAFVPKQWLYQKEATGMESSKIYYPSLCRNSTYQCGAANYPVSWEAV